MGTLLPSASNRVPLSKLFYIPTRSSYIEPKFFEFTDIERAQKKIIVRSSVGIHPLSSIAGAPGSREILLPAPMVSELRS